MACARGGCWWISRLNVSWLSQAVEGVELVFGERLVGRCVDGGGGGVDGLTHHVQGGKSVECCCGGSVFVAEEAHDDRERDALLVEVHRFGFAQQVAVDVRRDRRALSTCGFGGLLEHGGDGVGGQFGWLPAVQTVEQRPGRGECGDVGVELVEIDVQVLDGLVGEGHDAGLVALAGEQDVRGFGQAEVLQGQAGDLAHASRGVIQQDQQHPVSASLRGVPGERGKDRPGVSFVEVLDGPAGASRRFECFG